MTTLVSLHVTVSGRVQGVGYRAWTVAEARRLGLGGWVRNRRDGTVEALFCGVERKVRAMVDLCRDGPPAARVIEVRSDESCEQVFDFKSLPTH